MYLLLSVVPNRLPPVATGWPRPHEPRGIIPSSYTCCRLRAGLTAGGLHRAVGPILSQTKYSLRYQAKLALLTHPAAPSLADAPRNRPIVGVERRGRGNLVRFRYPKRPRPRDPADAQSKIHTSPGQALSRFQAVILSILWQCVPESTRTGHKTHQRPLCQRGHGAKGTDVTTVVARSDIILRELTVTIRVTDSEGWRH